jgi:hypothetical protein
MNYKQNSNYNKTRLKRLKMEERHHVKTAKHYIKQGMYVNALEAIGEAIQKQSSIQQIKFDIEYVEDGFGVGD